MFSPTVSREVPVGIGSLGHAKPSQQVYTYDLNVTLFSSSRTFSEAIDTEYSVLFAPDISGLPLLVKSWIIDLLKEFDNGSTCAAAIGRYIGKTRADFLDCLGVIGELETRGFLRTAPDPVRYHAHEVTPDAVAGMSIWLHINNHCNLDCSYCFVDKDGAYMPDTVMMETVERIVATTAVRGLKTIQLKFAGGEPTLSTNKMVWFHDTLLERLRGLDVRLHTSVLSNGTVISDQLIGFLQRPDVGLSISLDGYGADSHNLYRVFKSDGRGSWDLIMRNIERFRDNGIMPYILATISERSSATLTDLVRWIFTNKLRARLGVVRQPTEDSYREYGNLISRTSLLHKRQDPRARYSHLNQTMIAAFDAAFAELEKCEYEFNAGTDLQICELHFDRPSYAATCGIGSSHIVIQEDGRLASCPMTLREANIEPTDDLILSARKTLKASPEDRNSCLEKNCLDCQWFPVCTSGCPVNNERNTGTAFTISPLHDFYVFIIPRYLRLCGRKMLQRVHAQPTTIMPITSHIHN